MKSSEICSPKCIEQGDRQGLLVCHALSRCERASQWDGRTQSLTEVCVCVCVRTYTVVALSLCTLRFQTLPQRTAHWSEMNVVTWESKALLGSFPCPFHLHDDDCPHFFFQVFYNRHMPLFFRAPAKNSNRFCPFLLSLFFKTSLLPSKTTLHYSYSHDFL